MKKNRRHALAWLMVALIALPLSAQQQFTLEDLNFGGKNYRNMIAKNRSLTWWGDQLLRLSADTCWKVNPVNGKEKVLFTRDAINKAIAITLPSVDLGYKPLSSTTTQLLEVNTEIDITISKIIYGELPVDAWDEVMDKWWAQGGEQVIQDMNDYIKALNN